MTITTLITLNAFLAALVVYGIVWLLGSATTADRDSRAALRATGSAARDESDRTRIAA